MRLSKNIQAYLKRKQTGGEVNKRGNSYENYFTLFQIISIVNAAPGHLHDFVISSQANAFVDDLYIYNRVHSKHQYYQLKTSKRISWGNKFKSLAFDFKMQIKQERYLKRSFQLNLVVAEYVIFNALKQAIPLNIRKYTHILYFPYYPSIVQQIMHDPVFRKELQQICAVSDTDKLEALAKCLLGAWVSSLQKTICVSALVTSVRDMGYSYIKSSIPLHLDPQVHQILLTIPNFSYTIRNGYFTWQYGKRDSGISHHAIDSQDFRNIEHAIITQLPTTFVELEPIISV